MRSARWIVLLITHAGMLAVGFALGIYLLPILTAPTSPDKLALEATAATALFRGSFDRNLRGSDVLHWGEGEVRLTRDKIAHEGRLSPGPDYKLYLAPDFVDTKEDFLRIKSKATRVGDVKTFEGFLLDVPPNVDISAYTT